MNPLGQVPIKQMNKNVFVFASLKICNLYKCFLFIFTLYLFEFQKRKEPEMINENKKEVNLQTFPPEICSVCTGVMLQSRSGKSAVRFALDF